MNYIKSIATLTYLLSVLTMGVIMIINRNKSDWKNLFSLKVYWVAVIVMCVSFILIL